MSYSKSIHLVDIMKFISAMLVVGIHTMPMRNHEIVQTYIFWPLVSIAVPYFLIVSSYFFWNRENPNLKKWLTRIGLLYIVWLVIYSPLMYFEQFADGSMIRNLLIFFRGFFFGQTFPGSWYLNCSIWGIIISYVFWKHRINYKYLLAIGLLLYLIGKVLLFFHSILPDNIERVAVTFAGRFGWMQVSSFTYLVFIFLGCVLARENNWFNSFKSKWWLILGIFITVLELAFNHLYDYPMSVIGLLFIIPFLLAYTVTTPFEISNNLAIRLRKMSTLIYFTHPFFVHLPLFGPEFVSCHPITNYFIVLSISSLLAFVLSSEKLSKTIAVIKYLY